MKGNILLLAAGTLAVAIAGTVGAHDRDSRFRIATALKPVEEVPAISSTASGFFKATIDVENETLQYELSYEGIEGAPLQAHIHIGQMGVNGDISLFLCSNLPNPPTPTPPQACPVGPATITGTISAADIIGPARQGIAPTEFAKAASMIQRGFTYANVHSTRFPGGEIRGQIDGPYRKK